jgi:hypothetical protein
LAVVVVELLIHPLETKETKETRLFSLVLHQLAVDLAVAELVEEAPAALEEGVRLHLDRVREL